MDRGRAIPADGPGPVYLPPDLGPTHSRGNPGDLRIARPASRFPSAEPSLVRAALWLAACGLTSVIIAAATELRW